MPTDPQALETIKDEFRCPKRGGSAEQDAVFNYPVVDHWNKDHNTKGERTCSYCGGIHQDDLVPILKEAIDPTKPDTFVYMSDKPNKMYLRRPDVRNASDGAIKSYGGHGIPTGYDYDSFLVLLNEALAASEPKADAKFKAAKPDKVKELEAEEAGIAQVVRFKSDKSGHFKEGEYFQGTDQPGTPDLQLAKKLPIGDAVVPVGTRSQMTTYDIVRVHKVDGVWEEQAKLEEEEAVTKDTIKIARPDDDTPSDYEGPTELGDNDFEDDWGGAGGDTRL